MIDTLPVMEETRTRPPQIEPPTGQPDAPAFSVKNLSMWYGAKEAIRNVTIDIPARRVTAIIGPSGCGKSTFLRCLNRMHELAPRTRVTGEVLFEGRNLYTPEIDPEMIRRRIGMVRRPPPEWHPRSPSSKRTPREIAPHGRALERSERRSA